MSAFVLILLVAVAALLGGAFAGAVVVASQDPVGREDMDAIHAEIAEDLVDLRDTIHALDDFVAARSLRHAAILESLGESRDEQERRIDELTEIVCEFDARADAASRSALSVREILAALSRKHDEQARAAEEIGMLFQQAAERIA